MAIVHALVNETRKSLIIKWSYRFNIIVETVFFTLIFVALSFLLGNGQLAEQDLRPMLLGYLVTFYIMSGISDMSWGLREEARTGTLEQLYMSPTHASFLVFGRSISNFLYTTLSVILVFGAIRALMGTSLPIRLEGIPVFLVTMMGLFGFGLIFGGATLIFKQVETLANFAQNMMLFLNGTLLSVDQFPEAIEFFAKLVPSTQGIIVLRQVMLEELSLADVWKDGSFVILSIHSLIFLGIGMLVYRWCERVSKHRGNIGQY